MALRYLISSLALAASCEALAQSQTPPPAPPPEAPPQNSPQPPPPQDGGPGGRGQARIPNEVEVVRDVVYSTVKTDAGAEIELRFDAAFLKQTDGKPMPAIVYIHGGGWQGGSKEAGMQQCIALAMGGYFAATIQYRLADQAKFPAAVDDCKDAIRFLRKNSQELGIDPDRIGVWGHSAGGHLASMVGTTGNSDVFDDGEAEKSVSSAVKCCVDICGPTDLTHDIEGIVENFLGGSPAERGKKASPTTYVDASDPPVLIVHGTEDQLVNIRHAVSFERILKEAGVKVEYLPVEGAGHAITQPRAYARVAEFFDEHLGGKAAERVRALMRNNDGEPRQRPRRPNAPREPVGEGNPELSPGPTPPPAPG